MQVPPTKTKTPAFFLWLAAEKWLRLELDIEGSDLSPLQAILQSSARKGGREMQNRVVFCARLFLRQRSCELIGGVPGEVELVALRPVAPHFSGAIRLVTVALYVAMVAR